ncbi:MAG: hypothetical protein AMXMBFR81_14740 [Chthonomonas sp.]|nr:hypothetical protein [Fimbriimonadaceae bacterium]
MDDPIRPLSHILTTHAIQPDQRRQERHEARKQPDDVVELGSDDEAEEVELESTEGSEPIEGPLDFEA